ncbi:MAG: peptidyl-prolyl cis-trans isomerase SurA [Pseudohongiellaceae bacterium]|jgi:peptidyl-prolyl cis-trans isomerase SurA
MASGALETLNMNRLHAIFQQLGRHLTGFGISLCLVLAIVSSSSSAQRVLLDKIVAIVDSDVVLQSELDRRLIETRENAQRAGQPLPPEEQFRAEILEMLVVENLQMQFAERVSIRFDDDTINRVLNNMAQNNNMSFEEYVKTLEDNGVYLQTRIEVRKQMTIQELQRGMVNRRITITDQEIENFLNSETGREVMSEDYMLQDIRVVTNAADTPAVKEAKRRFAADLTARFQDGEPLTSAEPLARNAGMEISGSNLGWRKADALPTIFSNIVTDMTVNDVQGPIEAGNGFHIIQLVDKRGGTEQMVNQTNFRHIMLTPNEIRNEAQTITAIGELRERIQAGEEFASLARQNSDDASSVVAGGDLDWINEGGMPLEMAAVIDTLEVGELSEVFQSETGWHIAEVLGRREADLSSQYSRSQAENALRNRKFELELQNWLIEIREEAFVDVVE